MLGLLIATDNPGKRREYQELLAPMPLQLFTPSDLGIAVPIHEHGRSYAENARIKACAYVDRAGLLTLADDSGLEVDVLGGEPGLLSARYAGAHAGDADRYLLLLQRLQGVPSTRRTARFRCCLALAQPGGAVYETEGVCEGVVADEPHGDHGFGYDPVFYLPPFGLTMAQLPPEVKNRISHRARAVQAILPVLSQLLADQKG